MDIPSTPDNVSYAASVNARIDAETAKVRHTNRLMAAKAALWRTAGLGVVIIAAGIATGLACFGYSYISDNRASLDQLTAAFGKALQANTLHAEGVVGIRPDATVALAKDSHVALDPSSVSLLPGGMVSMRPGTVSLAPGSTVSIKSDMQDIVRQMQQNAGTDKAGRPMPEFDEVTAFHTTNFRGGEVVTGWKYHSKDNFANPYHQYCYYKERDDERVSRFFEMATNGKLNSNLKNPFNIDMREAFKSCTWHS